MKMHAPPHPGEIIKELCLDPLGLSITFDTTPESRLNQQVQYDGVTSFGAQSDELARFASAVVVDP